MWYVMTCILSAESESITQTLYFQTLPRPSCVSVFLKLEVYENVSRSFETPSCFRNVHTCHELVSKEGRNSLVVQVLIGVCHIQTYVNKKAYSDMNLCAHTRNEVRSPEKHVFLDS